MRHRTGCALLLAVVACSKSAEEPAAKRTPASAPTADSTAKRVRLCRRIDNDALAKLLGIPALTHTGNGSLVQGGGAPATLACSYYEGSKVDGGLSFGFRLSATRELEKRDVLGRFTWEPFAGLGQPAQIGCSKQGVHVQTIANGARLVVELEHPTIPVAELEPRIIAATKAVIAQLPADATTEVR
jgi:hypothetical protein